jgi:hypothetical protein
MNDENLIPNDERTPSELRAMTTNGGIKSGIARRKKRDLKERISSTWELATEMKKKELIVSLNGKLKLGVPEDDPEIVLLRDKIEVLGVGGVEMLTLMEIVTDPKVSAFTKTIAIENLFCHEYGKPKGNDTLKLEWGSGMGKSPAFSDESILLGIRHGIEKLTIQDLGKVIDMVELEKQSRLSAVDKLT